MEGINDTFRNQADFEEVKQVLDRLAGEGITQWSYENVLTLPESYSKPESYYVGWSILIRNMSRRIENSSNRFIVLSTGFPFNMNNESFVLVEPNK